MSLPLAAPRRCCPTPEPPQPPVYDGNDSRKISKQAARRPASHSAADARAQQISASAAARPRTCSAVGASTCAASHPASSARTCGVRYATRCGALPLAAHSLTLHADTSSSTLFEAATAVTCAPTCEGAGWALPL